MSDNEESQEISPSEPEQVADPRQEGDAPSVPQADTAPGGEQPAEDQTGDPMTAADESAPATQEFAAPESEEHQDEWLDVFDADSVPVDELDEFIEPGEALEDQPSHERSVQKKTAREAAPAEGGNLELLDQMLARNAETVRKLTSGFKPAPTISKKRASVKFKYEPFDPDQIYLLQSFFSTRKIGDRRNEDTEQVAAVLGSVFEALGVTEPMAQAMLANKFVYCQYHRMEMITVGEQPAEAFGIVLRGRCQILRAGMQDVGQPATLMRRRMIEPSASEKEFLIRNEEDQFGRDVPQGSMFGVELMQPDENLVNLWESSMMAVGKCDVLCVDKEHLQMLLQPPVPDMARRNKLLSKFPLLANETRHTLCELALRLQKTKVERNQMLLKQGEQCHHVLLLDGKTQIRELREVTVEKDGVKQKRVVELRSRRAPCMLNIRCVGADSRKGAQSTVLVSNPGTVYTLDRFTLVQGISTKALKEARSDCDETVSDKEIVDAYMQHVQWKSYKERLVEDVIDESVKARPVGQLY